MPSPDGKFNNDPNREHLEPVKTKMAEMIGDEQQEHYLIGFCLRHLGDAWLLLAALVLRYYAVPGNC
jgi:hypothetical protein